MLQLPRRQLLSALAGLGLFGGGLAGRALAAEPPGQPWQARATTPVEAQEKTFSSAGVTLSGTLYLPQGRSRLPAVVVTHAASSPSRDLPLYRHLVELLPNLGVAVFVYDRRGSGKSGGDLQQSDYELLADDAIAAQRMLAGDPRIDPKGIGFWGLSQGGWLSVLAAARSPRTAFAISISAPMTTADLQMNFASANILRIKGFAQADIDQALATRHAVDSYLRGELDRANAQAALDAAVGKPWFEHIYMSAKLGEPATSRWLKEMRHDPRETLERVTAPVLMIYGAADPWVPAQLSVERLAAAKRPNVDTVVIAGADHSMMLSVDEKTQIDPDFFPRLAPDAPAYFGLLGAWLTARGIARP